MKRRMYFKLNRRNRRSIFIAFFFILLIGVGYSYFSTSLSIEGYAKVNVPGWDVHFDNINVMEGSITPVNEARIIDDTTVSYSLEFSEPGTFYEFNVDVVNDGTIDAMIGDLDVRDLDDSVKDYIYYNVSYSDGTDLDVYDILRAGSSRTLNVRVKFLDDAPIESMEGDLGSINFILNVIYVQADGNAKDPVKPNYFAIDSFDKIANNIKVGNINRYEVGQTREIELNGYGTHTIRIANKSTPSECLNENFSQTGCGFVVEFADIITRHQMYSTTSNAYSWPGSTMRTFVNGDIYNSLPNDLQNIIIDTSVISGYGKGAANGSLNGSWISTDKIFLLDSGEIYGSSFGTSQHSAIGYERQLDYYSYLDTTVSNCSPAIKYNGENTSYWWLRSSYSSNNDGYFSVGPGGGGSNGGTSNNNSGVSPAFRIG